MKKTSALDPRRGALLGAGLCAALALGSTAAEIGVTDKEIRLGSCAVTAGPSSNLGLEQLNGAMAYLEHVNKKLGGVHGRKLKLLSFDDHYEPDKAVVCFQRLLEEQVFAGAFMTGAATLSKYVPMAEAQRLPIMGFNTGAQFLFEPVKRYVINVRASFNDETRNMVEHLIKEFGARRIGVIYQDDALGAAGLKGIKKALEAHDPKILVAEASFPRDSLDVKEAIAKVRAAEPEAVVNISIYGPGAEILKLAREQGWSPLFISLAGRDTLLKAAGPNAEGVVIAQVVPPTDEIRLPAIALYRKALKEYAPKLNPESYFALEGFVDAMVLVEGLKRAGKELTRDKFIDAIESIQDFDLGLGSDLKVNYSPKDHKAFDTSFFMLVKDGKLVRLADWKALKKAAPHP